MNYLANMVKGGKGSQYVEVLIASYIREIHRGVRYDTARFRYSESLRKFGLTYKDTNDILDGAYKIYIARGIYE